MAPSNIVCAGWLLLLLMIMVQDDQQHVLPGANKCSCSCCTWPVFAAVLTGRTRRQLNPPQRAAVIIIIVISRSGDRGDSRTNSASQSHWCYHSPLLSLSLPSFLILFAISNSAHRPHCGALQQCIFQQSISLSFF